MADALVWLTCERFKAAEPSVPFKVSKMAFKRACVAIFGSGLRLGTIIPANVALTAEKRPA